MSPAPLGRGQRRPIEILRQLYSADARLVRLRGDEFGVLEHGVVKPSPRASEAKIKQWLADGVIAREPSGRYALTGEGIAHVKRALASAQPFQAQHQDMGTRYVSDGEGRGQVRVVNLAESPLAWLASRKGPDGKPFLSGPQVEAGERLREDYNRAQLMARVTVDWTLPLSGNARSTDRGLTISEAALAARQRVQGALAAVGPGLDDILVRVCCHLQGLEEAEKLLRWPPRAAKIVLAIALESLAKHYGLVAAPKTAPALRVWQAQSL